MGDDDSRARPADAISSAVQMHGMDGDQVGAEQAQAAQSLDRAHAVLLEAVVDLGAGLVQVDVDRQIELGGQRGDALEGPVADGVGRVRGQAKESSGSSRQASRAASPLAR